MSVQAIVRVLGIIYAGSIDMNLAHCQCLLNTFQSNYYNCNMGFTTIFGETIICFFIYEKNCYQLKMFYKLQILSVL